MQKENFILVIVIVTFLLAALIFIFIGTIFLLYQKKETAHRRQLEEVRNKFRHELLQSKLDIHEETLLTISRDIHDNMGNLISSAKHCLNTMLLEGEPEEKRLVAVDCLTKALEEVRDLSKNLSLELIKSNGLTFAIEKQIEQLRKMKSFNIRFETLGNYDFLDEQREVFIFRILQEALSNIIRHAAATEIYVLIDNSSSDGLRLLVEDNGRGFKTETRITTDAECGSGGISHMISRVKLIAGKILLRSSPGNGTAVSITIPYNPIYGEPETLDYHSVGGRSRADYKKPGNHHK